MISLAFDPPPPPKPLSSEGLFFAKFLKTSKKSARQNVESSNLDPHWGMSLKGGGSLESGRAALRRDRGHGLSQKARAGHGLVLNTLCLKIPYAMRLCAGWHGWHRLLLFFLRGRDKRIAFSRSTVPTGRTRRGRTRLPSKPENSLCHPCPCAFCRKCLNHKQKKGTGCEKTTRA